MPIEDIKKRIVEVLGKMLKTHEATNIQIKLLQSRVRNLEARVDALEERNEN
jgi:hypothetical protein